MADVSTLEMIGQLGLAALKLVPCAFGVLHLVMIVACVFGGGYKGTPHTEHPPKQTP